MHRRCSINVECCTNIPYVTFVLKKKNKFGVSIGTYIITGFIGLGATEQLQLDLLFINQCIFKIVIFKEEQRFSLNKASDRNLKNSVQNIDPAITLSR